MAIAKTAEGVLFEIHVTGVVTGKTWAGRFRAKPLLSFRDQMGMDRMRRELLGGDIANADPNVIVQAAVLADLSFRLTEFPDWWTANGNGLDLADPNVLEAIYIETKKVEEDYLKTISNEAEKAREEIREKVVDPKK